MVIQIHVFGWSTGAVVAVVEEEGGWRGGGPSFPRALPAASHKLYFWVSWPVGGGVPLGSGMIRLAL